MDIKARYEIIARHKGGTSRLNLGEVSSIQLERFVLAIGSPSEVSVQNRYDSAQAVFPLLLSSVMCWGSGSKATDLRHDGTELNQLSGLPVDGLRLMGAGQELEISEAVVEGLEFIQETVVEDVQYKEGRSGDLIFITIVRTFSQNSKVVLRCKETFIAR